MIKKMCDKNFWMLWACFPHMCGYTHGSVVDCYEYIKMKSMEIMETDLASCQDVYHNVESLVTSYDLGLLTQ